MTSGLISEEKTRIRKGRLVFCLGIALVTLIVLVVAPYVGEGSSGGQGTRASRELLGIEAPLKPLGTEFDLSKGKFLVASRKLRDPNFAQTVVLLLEYDRDGALGLVINRPTELKLSRLLPDITALQERADPVYYGGPVSPTQMLVLLRSSNQPEGAHPVFENVYVSSNRTALERLIEDPESEEKFRVYAGYAGWTSGQLDGEVSAGGWHVFEADAEAVFDKEPSGIWPDLIRQTSVLFAGK
jgi:putative transcriptional regulator